MNVIELEKLTKTYFIGDMAVPVLTDITMTVSKGEYIALMGASGSGKSTLMNLLGCLDTSTSGTYRLVGLEVASFTSDQRAEIRNSKIGFVFQSFNLLRRTSALQNVLMPLSYSNEILSDKEAEDRATEMLCRVGLKDRLHYEPARLSGGQQQRVAIARALINKPSILLADEPTGNLDSRTSQEILAMFHELHTKDGITIILVTHEQDVAENAQRIIRIQDGKITSADSSIHIKENTGRQSP